MQTNRQDFSIYAAELLKELAIIAVRLDMRLFAYLLEMAAKEAEKKRRS